MNQRLATLLRNWERLVLGGAVAFALVVLAVWMLSFLFSPDQEGREATSQNTPPRLFDQKNLNFRHAPTLSDGVNPLSVRLAIRNGRPSGNSNRPQNSQPAQGGKNNRADQPAQGGQPADGKQPAQGAPAQQPAASAAPADGQPATSQEPAKPPHLLHLTYHGFYRGVSGVPLAMLTIADSLTGADETKWLPVGSVSDDLELTDFTEEEITVTCHDVRRTFRRGEVVTMSLP